MQFQKIKTDLFLFFIAIKYKHKGYIMKNFMLLVIVYLIVLAVVFVTDTSFSFEKKSFTNFISFFYESLSSNCTKKFLNKRSTCEQLL